jgi:hypothetical protein
MTSPLSSDGCSIDMYMEDVDLGTGDDATEADPDVFAFDDTA